MMFHSGKQQFAEEREDLSFGRSRSGSTTRSRTQEQQEADGRKKELLSMLRKRSAKKLVQAASVSATRQEECQ